MGAFDEIKNAVNGHEEQIKEAIDKAADAVDAKTEGKYAEQVDKIQEVLKEQVDKA